MGIGYEIGSAIAGAATDIFKTGYDIWTNQRDFDYQKNLQQEIFAREDNAVQRRMEDLKKAGLNPNLAAGSAAGAGSVVGRSNTPTISGNPVGTALDMAQHIQQLRKQSSENKILKNEEVKSKEEADNARWNTFANEYEIFSMLGMKPNIKYDYNTGEYYISTSNNPNAKNAFQELLDYQIKNNKNSSDMLQKENDFFVADKIADYIGAGARALSGFGSGFYSFRRGRR